MEVKKPADSKSEWDYYNVLATIPASEAFIDPAKSGCPSSPVTAARHGAPTTRRFATGAPRRARAAARGLRKEFAGFVAVKDVDIDLYDGQIKALIGPNGAGKSTVFNLLTKFLKPPPGSIELMGTGHHRPRPAARRPAWGSCAPSRSPRCSPISPCSTTSASRCSGRTASRTSSGSASAPSTGYARADELLDAVGLATTPTTRRRPLLRPQARARDRHHPRPRPARAPPRRADGRHGPRGRRPHRRPHLPASPRTAPS